MKVKWSYKQIKTRLSTSWSFFHFTYNPFKKNSNLNFQCSYFSWGFMCTLTRLYGDGYIKQQTIFLHGDIRICFDNYNIRHQGTYSSRNLYTFVSFLCLPYESSKCFSFNKPPANRAANWRVKVLLWTVRLSGSWKSALSFRSVGGKQWEPQEKLSMTNPKTLNLKKYYPLVRNSVERHKHKKVCPRNSFNGRWRNIIPFLLRFDGNRSWNVPAFSIDGRHHGLHNGWCSRILLHNGQNIWSTRRTFRNVS